MTVKTMPKAFAVMFSQLEKWSVDCFQVGKWVWPKEFIKKVSDLAIVRREGVSLHEAEQLEIPIIEKINFSGELFLRPLSDYKQYKGMLFRVLPGDLIFSKINAKRGCIYFHSGKEPFLVSNEYPVLNLNTEIAGEYLNLALRTDLSKEQMSAVAAGMAKARTSLGEFLNLTIPVPPLPIQKRIADYWQQGQNKIHDKVGEINNLKSAAEKHFFESLGLKQTKIGSLTKCFALQWSEIDRWGVNHNQMKLIASDLTKSKYSVVTIGSVLESMQYGTSEKATRTQSGIPILRIKNIKEGAIDYSDLK